jgi:hypothetical protein
MEGRKDSRLEGRKDSRTAGRTDGRTDRRYFLMIYGCLLGQYNGRKEGMSI